LLYGGSFNPIHNGHIGIAQSVADQLQTQRVVLIPAGQPPHKLDQTLASAEHRIAMCRLAASECDLRFEVSDWETRQTGPSYTLKTIEHFRSQMASPLYWLIGMDSLAELHTWYHIEQLVEACTIVTVGRPGVCADWSALSRILSERQIARLEAHLLTTPLYAISSTQIRGLAAKGASLGDLVPASVAEYIAAQRLYVS
jgi:nicotinate-nucleotide adenylyltransferase